MAVFIAPPNSKGSEVEVFDFMIGYPLPHALFFGINKLRGFRLQNIEPQALIA